MWQTKLIKQNDALRLMKKITLLFIITTLFSGVSFGQTNFIDSIAHQTYQRKYTVHTPTGFTNASPTAAVLMLHGNGGTMLNSQNFTNLNSVSNANGFIAVYPEGLGAVSTGGFSWADGRGTSADNAGIDDLGFINKLLDTLLANYNIDANKIYICGFSNGGYMTQRFACEQNQRFAAMASLGSIMDITLFTSCNPQRPIPMMFVVGTADPFVPFNGGTAFGAGGLVNQIISADTLVNFWKSNNNCLQTNPPVNLPDINQADSSTVTVFSYSNCSCNADVKFYRINGGGHTWPGVPNPIYELIAGPTNNDMQASVELWNFFSQYELCNLATGLEDLETSNGIHIYPNPTSSRIIIETKSNGTIQYQITSIAGQIIKSGAYNKEIDIVALRSGIYILTIKKDNKVINRKIIKE